MQGRGGTGDPCENPPISVIVRHDSHMRKSRCDPAGCRTRFAWWEASGLTTTPPRPQNIVERLETMEGSIRYCATVTCIKWTVQQGENDEVRRKYWDCISHVHTFSRESEESSGAVFLTFARSPGNPKKVVGLYFSHSHVLQGIERKEFEESSRAVSRTFTRSPGNLKKVVGLYLAHSHVLQIAEPPETASVPDRSSPSCETASVARRSPSHRIALLRNQLQEVYQNKFYGEVEELALSVDGLGGGYNGFGGKRWRTNQQYPEKTHRPDCSLRYAPLMGKSLFVSRWESKHEKLNSLAMQTSQHLEKRQFIVQPRCGISRRPDVFEVMLQTFRDNAEGRKHPSETENLRSGRVSIQHYNQNSVEMFVTEKYDSGWDAVDRSTILIVIRRVKMHKKGDWASNGKESATAFVKDSSQHPPPPGVISENHGEQKSRWPDRESNPCSPQGESNGIQQTRKIRVGIGPVKANGQTPASRNRPDVNMDWRLTVGRQCRACDGWMYL
ncbi:hypothetical protein PR048_031779 [Dryococelus australis]|uniref:Uncharacterized protein n=1 Tax=Dryococelus australis TaxID=614101 RepID=A0ABQ9G687_9NEOP|nr:hypothetical protein PR048_031779 [Dryococelus australis]